MRQTRGPEGLQKEDGEFRFYSRVENHGGTKPSNQLGCYEEKGPQGSRGRSRKASENSDVIIQVISTWWLGQWWVEEMERRGWVLHVLWKNSYDL